MAARGAMAKEAIFAKILETFEGSFVYNSGKEVRIPWDENGNRVEIKVTLTAAKDNVGDALGGAAVVKEEDTPKNFPEPHKNIEPSVEEKKNVEDLLKSLGLV